MRHHVGIAGRRVENDRARLEIELAQDLLNDIAGGQAEDEAFRNQCDFDRGGVQGSTRFGER